MPNPFEAMPLTRVNLQFPGGDAHPREIERAGALFSELTTGTQEENLTKLQLLRKAELTQWRSISGQATVSSNLEALADRWADSYESGIQVKVIAGIGMFSMLAFMKQSRILPVARMMPFTEELERMEAYNPEEVQLFANEAWSCMRRSHPAIHGVLEAWLEHLATLNEVEETLNPGLLDATTALPYVLASATRMHGYMTRDFDAKLARFAPLPPEHQ